MNIHCLTSLLMFRYIVARTETEEQILRDPRFKRLRTGAMFGLSATRKYGSLYKRLTLGTYRASEGQPK